MAAAGKPNKTPRTWLSRAPLALLFTLLVFSFGFYVGKYGIPPQQPRETAGRLTDLSNFWKTKELIEEKYVNDVNSQNLITGATKGLVEGLDDPYSAFLTREEAKQLNQALSGTVEGIGVEIGEQNDQITVIAPVPGSPAARAGIVTGDVIMAVENRPTDGQSVDEVAKQIRGPRGTQVTLQVKHAHERVPRSLTITRETVKAPSVRLEYRDNTAVITLSRYGDDTKAELNKIVEDIKAKQAKGIVLDLRSNPGGFLDGAIDVASVFLSEGIVVREQFSHDRAEVRSVNHDGRLATMPVVVLINKGTASAAEITAGALRDNRGVKLVGTKTFGKGSVQELEEVGDGAVLKLTVAEWLTPKGTSISKQGIEPDIEVPDDKPDEQLNTALAQLK